MFIMTPLNLDLIDLESSTMTLTSGEQTIGGFFLSFELFSQHCDVFKGY